MKYTIAVEQIEALEKDEKDKIEKACKTTLMTHGKKTSKVLVCFHGITNCPYQFTKLGADFYKKGFNVFIPRIPYHGYKDKLTLDLKNLDAKKITSFADEVFDIAQGLGESVYVMGLSAGGVITTYIASKHPAYRCMAIAPALSFPVIPWFIQKPLIAFAKALKPVFVWWTEPLKVFSGPEVHALPKASKAYPRFSIRALAMFFDIGTGIICQLSKKAPKAHSFVLLTNENDATTHPEAIKSLGVHWGGKLKSKYVHHTIEKKWNLPHDFIDPTQPDSAHNIKVGYPIIKKLMLAK